MVADAVCAVLSVSATETVTLYEPFDPDAGVPEITPAGLRARPAGRFPEIDQVYGLVPPVTPRVWV
jgi:hypothetical protein